jgi:ABC-2 type transport system ATP-binding protein
MIEVENLTKYYGNFPAVRDVTFNVEPGEILGFLGPNGAGKTTTMRMITGYVPATSGKVRVAGFDVAEKSMQARAHLGYLPETVPLYTELTPMEYLDFKGRISGMHNGRERRARIWEVMVELNLTDVANKLIGALSRGYRQRVGLAQAILHNPDVLILDEPTVGLDPVQITEVRDLIRRLGENHTVILSTHLLPEVSMVCNRVIIINRGRLVALDTPFHLAGEQKPLIAVEALGPKDEVLRVIRSVPGVLSASLDGTQDEVAEHGALVYHVDPAEDQDVRPEIASALINGGYRLVELKAVRPSLEEIFLQIVTQDQAVIEEEEYPEDVEPGDEVPAEELEAEYAEGEDELEASAAGSQPAARSSGAIRARRRTRR